MVLIPLNTMPIFQYMLSVFTIILYGYYPTLCVKALISVRRTSSANYSQISVFVSELSLSVSAPAQMALFPIEKTKGPYFCGCNQLAALSAQQHFGLCMLTFLFSIRSHLPVSTTAWITRVYFIWSLSCDDMRGKDKWWRYSSHSATRRKEKHTSGH